MALWLKRLETPVGKTVGNPNSEQIFVQKMNKKISTSMSQSEGHKIFFMPNTLPMKLLSPFPSGPTNKPDSLYHHIKSRKGESYRALSQQSCRCCADGYLKNLSQDIIN